MTTWAEQQLTQITTEMEHTKMDMNNDNRALSGSPLRDAAASNQRSSIESALETMEAAIENLFDEIHRLGNRIGPILVEPFVEKPSTGSDSMESGSGLRDNIVNKTFRLHNAIRDLSNYTARVDLS